MIWTAYECQINLFNCGNYTNPCECNTRRMQILLVGLLALFEHKHHVGHCWLSLLAFCPFSFFQEPELWTKYLDTNINCRTNYWRRDNMLKKMDVTISQVESLSNILFAWRRSCNMCAGCRSVNSVSRARDIEMLHACANIQLFDTRHWDGLLHDLPDLQLSTQGQHLAGKSQGGKWIGQNMNTFSMPAWHTNA